ncbi:MAG TPA: hypothetical protein V6C81_27675 [Planktothrix sp.]
MIDDNTTQCEDTSTGLSWPATWTGAYLIVVGNFVLWLVALVALTEFSK